MSSEQPDRILLTKNQRWMLSHVADVDGYGSRDGNEDRTLFSLRRRGLVSREGGGYWWTTALGTEMVAAWDSAGCM